MKVFFCVFWRPISLVFAEWGDYDRIFLDLRCEYKTFLCTLNANILRLRCVNKLLLTFPESTLQDAQFHAIMTHVRIIWPMRSKGQSTRKKNAFLAYFGGHYRGVAQNQELMIDIFWIYVTRHTIWCVWPMCHVEQATHVESGFLAYFGGQYLVVAQSE